ncbi:hypothetical protein HDU87_006422 [Geranomyces variabilis]|uniref:Uncharacterized protein n=1 Tax=Geranomyces variabilis TaxID=109894 RepID=A0AAD5TG41_9FUNG|nr:hypothetical protein HDU87_006422 [Geranomyces variabilis]
MDDNTELWANPDWCDWRTRIRGCSYSDVWVTYYVVHTFWAYIAGALGLLVCYRKVYQKVWKHHLSLFELVDGGIRPRAAETFVIGATIHLFLRAIYTTVILAGGFGSQAANESFHELPWHILYSSACLLSVGVIYATPRHRLASNKMRAVRLPSYTVLNIILFGFCLVPMISLQILAALAGHARDNNEADKARNYNAGHYGLWSFYCWTLGGVTLYFGITLIKLLRASASPQSSGNNVAAEAPKNGSNATNISQNGGESTAAADTNGRAGFRRAVMTLIVTIGCTFIMDLHKSAKEQQTRFRSNRGGLNSDPSAASSRSLGQPQEQREKWGDIEADRQPPLYPPQYPSQYPRESAARAGSRGDMR